jgi:hypothetical protein
MAMHPVLPNAFPEPPRGLWGEQVGRLILTVALVALALALHTVLIAGSLRPGWAALSGLFLFGLGMATASLLQGGRPGAGYLVTAGGLALLAGVLLHVGVVPLSVPLRDLFGLVMAMVAAACLGIWAARGIRSSSEWLTVILCAAVGDAWLTVLGVTEGLSEAHPLGWLRMSEWARGEGRLAPVFTDLFFAALYVEAGRRLGLRVSLQVFGALAGFAGAQVVSLTTWQAMPILPLVGLGVLVGAWTELRCSPREVMRGLGVAMLFFALLLALVFVRRALHPQLRRKPEFFLPRDVATAKEGGREAIFGVTGASGERASQFASLAVLCGRANLKNDIDGI